MTSKIVVQYTEEELQAMLKVLYLLYQFTEDKGDNEVTSKMEDWSDNAFNYLSLLMELDPAGARLFHENGW